ncbi:hypothetical protein JDV02_000195 [Purpureocillium takamizusanense]|uniref:Uncharacterized protein n=1 Tax=Purpureocillium takamizusanense TaxID=2060973 RepID=A0A9Q8Q4A6_9HYPO|nr:uncharacterized protein JDV02_000195 [Purpureocillium takamizusanense]UNI13449.1 hypothetical protein JDV02_000195 [Purpureocillium takamizusanense]
MTPSPARVALLLAPFPSPSRHLAEAALPLFFTRRIHSSSSSSYYSPPRSHKSDKSAWPLLKRRARPPPLHDAGAATKTPSGQELFARLDDAASPTSDTLAIEQQQQQQQQQGLDSAAGPAVAKADSHVMLTIHGLSTNLNASDFYRIAPSSLSSWHSAIKKVQQERDPSTLEPLGRYHVSFSTPAAATVYRDRLVRLHRLARHRMRSATGLWEASTPPHLRSPDVEPAAELAGFTVAPPPSPPSNPSSSSSSPSTTSRVGLDIDKRRVSAGVGAWARRLAGLVGGAEHAHGDKPPVVLLRVYPPTLSAEDLRRRITDDGVTRGCRWKVSPPQCLQPPRHDAQDKEGKEAESTRREATALVSSDRDTPETVRGRFVVVCETEAEARRFHRHWNQRALLVGAAWGVSGVAVSPTTIIVHASIVSW